MVLILFWRSNTDNSNWFIYLSGRKYHFWCSTGFCFGSAAFFVSILTIPKNVLKSFRFLFNFPLSFKSFEFKTTFNKMASKSAEESGKTVYYSQYKLVFSNVFFFSIVVLNSSNSRLLSSQYVVYFVVIRERNCVLKVRIVVKTGIPENTNPIENFISFRRLPESKWGVL